MSIPISGDVVRQAYKNAPLPIRDAFNSDKTVRSIMAIKSKYQLHVDAAGELGKEIGYLLLGITSPMEFLGRLVESGVDGTVAKNIANDINVDIFIPLQQIMRNPGSYVSPNQTDSEEEPDEDGRTPAQEGLSGAAPSTLASVPALEYVPPAARTLPGSPVAAPMPETPKPVSLPVVPEVVAQAPVPTYHTAYPTPNPPQQGWHSAAAVHIYVPSHGAPFPQPAQAPIATPVESREVSQPIPAYEPVFQPYVAPQAPITAPESPSMPAAPTQNTQVPIKKDYAADPYREPV